MEGNVRRKAERSSNRRGSTAGSLRANLSEQKKARVKTKGYSTESERAFMQPRQQRPSAEELSKPMRSVAGKKVVPKRVDLGVAGESDGIIPQDEPREGPTHEIHEIYPENFVGAAGTSSGLLYKQMAKSHVVEYFPEKPVQDYVSGEVDELIFGERLDPKPKLGEIPMLNPRAYMQCAGLTSKEQAHRVNRNALAERLESAHAPPKPFVDTHADEVIYGRSTSDPMGQVTCPSDSLSLSLSLSLLCPLLSSHRLSRLSSHHLSRLSSHHLSRLSSHHLSRLAPSLTVSHRLSPSLPPLLSCRRSTRSRRCRRRAAARSRTRRG